MDDGRGEGVKVRNRADGIFEYLPHRGLGQRGTLLAVEEIDEVAAGAEL